MVLLTLSLCLDCFCHALCTCLHPFLVSLPFQLGRIDYSSSRPSLYLFQTPSNMLLNFYCISCWQIQESRSLMNSKQYKIKPHEMVKIKVKKTLWKQLEEKLHFTYKGTKVLMTGDFSFEPWRSEDSGTSFLKCRKKY